MNVNHNPNLSAAVKNDIVNSDREPIYIHEGIQSHGVLLFLREPDLTILQVSNNTLEFFGMTPESLLNGPLNLLLDLSQIEILKSYLAYENLQAVNPIKLSIATKSPLLFDGIIHRRDRGLILELEPATSQINLGLFDFYHLIKLSITKLHNTTTFQQLCQIAVKEVRKIAGFDRVMLYKFDRDGHGIVIAEDKLKTLEPFLGLHYPASDIPQQARAQFSQVSLRLISDVNSQVVGITPENNPLTKQPLDISLSGLRTTSTCHVQYLKNMGVAASMTLSIFKDRHLWGLIACHHQTPKFIPYEVRAACEFFGQSMSSEISAKEYNEDYEYQLKLKDIQAKLLEAMSAEDNFVDGLVKQSRQFLNLTNAQGAAVCLGKELTLLGQTPNPQDIQKLIDWLSQIFHENVFYTDSLSLIYPEAKQYKKIASGLLAIYISKDRRKYVLWFRPEVTQTVKWAGNPNPVIEREENGRSILSPRQSFALWKEIVEFKSLPWKACEIEEAIELKNAIVNVVLRKADELEILNAQLRKSETREREKARKLELTLKKLQRTQTQLIQSEKLSSLGQLVAGVAHEINNPVNFIYGNLSYAEAYTRDLLALLELYAKHYPEPVPEIQAETEAIELEFLIEDLPKLLGSMQMGADRIREIVRSLRNFSRLDESDKKSVDIHEGIDSTLLILKNRLKARSSNQGIQVIKKYGKLPAIDCYPSQLNQVFMNILANAIDALEEYNHHRSPAELKAEPSKIEIGTYMSGETLATDRPLSRSAQRRAAIAPAMRSIIVRIADNGPGIPQEIQSKLFDPFFTTKPIGKGTGIGLAISYQIVVEKHGGQLKCISAPGQGTEFVVEIPIQGA